MAELYPPLLLRLAAGLVQADELLAGRRPVSLRERDSGDFTPLLRELWQRFLDAGRLRPESSELHLTGPLRWPGEPVQHHSLLLNLLTNACEAAPDGPVLLTADPTGLRVENGGRGLTPELVDQLNHGRAPAPASGRGQGLGLILRGASELGLRLQVETGASRTRFVLAREDPDAPALLLVEDDDELRVMLTELFRREGWRVEERRGDEETEPRAGAYRVVVADLNLPAQGGDHFLSAWKRVDPAAHTLLLTGESEASERRHDGVDAVVIKPGLQRLLAILATLRESAR